MTLKVVYVNNWTSVLILTSDVFSDVSNKKLEKRNASWFFFGQRKLNDDI